MHQPTVRVLEVLQSVLQNSGSRQLSDFSRELNIPKSTLHPILQTLCENRYLYQDELGRYRAGTALFSMGAAFSGCFPLLDYAGQELEQLVETFRETCFLGTLVQGDVLYLCKRDSPHSLRFLTETGRRLPAYATGLGKALLLDHTPQQLQALYPHGLKPLTGSTVPDLAALHQQLAQARILGCTREQEESTENVRCFGVPIRKFGKITAAVSMAIPLFRYEEEKKDAIIQALCTCAAKIGATMEATDAHFGELF